MDLDIFDVLCWLGKFYVGEISRCLVGKGGSFI
jgi:hypothetical protein